MEVNVRKAGSGFSEGQLPALRFLVESALRKVSNEKKDAQPHSRAEWIAHLGESLMSDSDSSYQSVLASLAAHGVSSEDINQIYVPEAARHLGELWVSDKASFVDVTVGAARLQRLFRGSTDEIAGNWSGRLIPLGQPVLMVIPKFEDHSLGAFVAADGFRRHGLWVHMAIGFEADELAELLSARRFSMIGFSLATLHAAEKTVHLIDAIRNAVEDLPPLVIGGRVADEVPDLDKRTGADFAVKSVREAIESCCLSSVSSASGVDQVVC